MKRKEPKYLGKMLNKWRIPASRELRGQIGDLAFRLEQFEKATGQRRRTRKGTKKQTFDACVSALYCNLLHRYMTSEDGDGLLAVSLRTSVKATRYKSPIDSSLFPHVVKLMVERGDIELVEKGSFLSKRSTTVRASEHLKGTFAGYWFEDLGLDGDQEIVILKNHNNPDLRDANITDDWVDYRDNNFTRKARAQVREINTFLSHADIQYTGSRLVDVYDRRMRRYFNNSTFDLGGRLFGGFWMKLHKKECKPIKIDGEHIAEVDYTGMQLALACADLGRPMNLKADPYQIWYDSGFSSPGDMDPKDNKKLPRASVKTMLAVMLNAPEDLKAWPEGMHPDHFHGLTLSQVKDIMYVRYSWLQDKFWTGYGLQLMRTESDILVEVLLRLKEKGIRALPKHDCVLVGRSHAATACTIMRETFKELTGGEVALTINGKPGLEVVSTAPVAGKRV